MKYPPKQFQQNADVKKDKFFFIDVYGFDKFKFVNTDEIKPSGRNLYMTGYLPQGVSYISKISDLSGKNVFFIGSKND